jgi:AraC family transcriptional regulator of adaptative response/methylated-DNA-[protein]-cysteine methyltransferase
MNEIIRYAWSKSSLGEFLIAVSGKGLVAFEFGGRRATKDGRAARAFPGSRHHCGPGQLGRYPR